MHVPVGALLGQQSDARSGQGAMYDDDGWSDAYLEGAASWRNVSWALRGNEASHGAPGASELEVTVHPASGCILAPIEPGQPEVPKDTSSGDTSAGESPRSWRLLLHGVPPPREVLLRRASSGSAGGRGFGSDKGGGGGVGMRGGGDLIPFADPAAAERWRRADSKIAHWSFDSERLCVIVWLFEALHNEALSLSIRMMVVRRFLCWKACLPMSTNATLKAATCVILLAPHTHRR